MGRRRDLHQASPRTTRADTLRWSRPADGVVIALLFLPPALLVFTIFVTLPIGDGVWFSLFDWSGYGRPGHFVGLRNYATLLASPQFRDALLNNVLVIAVSILVEIPIAVGAGILLAGDTRLAVPLRLVFFLPYTLAEVATGVIWRFAFDGNVGLVASAANALGLDPPFMLADPTLARVALLIVVVWKFAGLHMLLIIAGLRGIDAEVLDAALLDGASLWQRFRHITLPLLWPTIRVSVFLALIGSLQLFDVVMPLTGGGPGDATQTAATFLYTYGFMRMRAGFGSAAGIVLFALSTAVGLGYALVPRRQA